MNKRTTFAAVAVCALMLTLLPLKTNASLINTTTPNAVYDDFQNGVKKPDTTLPWDYWYYILDSADSQGFLRLENLQSDVHENNAVSFNLLNDGASDKYMRMTLSPEQYPGFFNVVQLSDQRDGYTYGVPHRWLPTVGHPIVMQTRFRASANYQTDGNGTAVGTFGMWLQNNPDELTDAAKLNPSRDPSFNDHHDNFYAFGFNWVDQYAVGGFLKGFKSTIIDQSALAPIINPITSGLNINDWNTVKTVWSVDESGTQTVTFYVNDAQVAQNVLAVPMPSLSIAVWADNEQPQFGPNGIIYAFANPTADQNFDVNTISVSQQ